MTDRTTEPFFGEPDTFWWARLLELPAMIASMPLHILDFLLILAAAPFGKQPRCLAVMPYEWAYDVERAARIAWRKRQRREPLDQ